MPFSANAVVDEGDQACGDEDSAQGVNGVEGEENIKGKNIYIDIKGKRKKEKGKNTKRITYSATSFGPVMTDH